MWSNLVVFHSELKERHLVEPEGLFAWKTCMRSVFVGDIRLMDIHLENQYGPYTIHYGYSAFQLLLEITSGIRSKLFGETEVFRQFKETFHNENLPKTAFGEYLQKLRDELIEDTRKIRSQYLIGLGDQSYGGLARRFLENSRKITLLGTGQLAEQILPYIADSGREVLIVGRNHNRLQELSRKFSVKTTELVNKIPVQDAFIISAPVKVAHLLDSSTRNPKIIDFRENDEGDQFSNFPSYYSFSYILETLQKNEKKNQKLKRQLEIIVSKIVEEREYVSSNNIFCWEDIPCIASLK